MVCAEDMAIIYGYEYEQTVGHGYKFPTSQNKDSSDHCNFRQSFRSTPNWIWW